VTSLLADLGLAHLAPALRAVLAPPGSARPLPRAAFVDPRSLALDAEALFRGCWVAVADAADLAPPGAWSRAAWPGRGDLVVARTAELGLSLLAATCRHRGVALLEGERGRVPDLAIACPYHGWTYDLGGRLRRAPGLAAPHDAATLGLAAGRVATLGGEVLAALDPAPGDGPQLPRWLADAPLDALRRAHQATWEVAANWKLVVANFQESHHFPRVHPALEARTPFVSSTSVIPDHGTWLGGTMDLVDGVETVSPDGLRDGRPFLAAPGDRRRVHDAWLRPNLLTSLQPDYLLTYRLEPMAVDRTRVAFAIDVHASAPAACGIDELARYWAAINAEDQRICEAQQRGLAAAGPGFELGPYAASEDGLHAFEARVASAWLALHQRSAGAA
jgi:Rieske 2Fe-2S family protein